MRCFDRIKQDSRHRGIIILSEETSPDRFFAGWDMAVVGVASFDEALRCQMLDLLQIRNHSSFENIRQNKIVSIIVETYLSNLDRFARSISR